MSLHTGGSGGGAAKARTHNASIIDANIYTPSFTADCDNDAITRVSATFKSTES